MGPIIADIANDEFAEGIAAQAADRARRGGAQVIVCVNASAGRRRPAGFERALGRLQRVPPVEYLSGHPISARRALVDRLHPSLFITSPGLTALLLMRAVATPVLIDRPTFGRGLVIGATDYRDPGFPALSAATEEAACLRLRLALCHIVDAHTRVRLAALGFEGAADDVREQLRAYARTRSLEADVLVASGDPAIELSRLVDLHRAALLVLARRKGPPQSRRFVPTAGDMIVLTVACPVLVVPKTLSPEVNARSVTGRT